MKQGVVLSVNKFSITLLTPEGEFEKSKRLKRDYEIGEEIIYSPAVNPLQSFLSFSGKKTAVISGLVTCILLFSIAIPLFSGHVSAYMTIDVNPSIELGLDDELHVIEMNGLNRDGQKVIAQLHDWKNQDVSDVAKNVVKKTKELGYLNASTRKVIVSETIIDDNQKLNQQLNQEVKRISKQIPVENGEVHLIHATERDRDKAKQQGISTGKFVEQQIEKRKNDKLKKNDDQRKVKTTNESVKEKTVNSKGTVKNNKQATNHEIIHHKSSEKPSKNLQEIKQDAPKNKGNLENRNHSGSKGYSKMKDHSKNKNNSESKDYSEHKRNSGNKDDSRVKGNSGDKNDSKVKGNSRNKNDSKVKGNSRNKNDSKVKGNSGNKDDLKVKGNSGNKESAKNKGNSENKGHQK